MSEPRILKPKITNVADPKKSDKSFFYRLTRVIVDDEEWDAIAFNYSDFVSIIINRKKPLTVLDWRAIPWMFDRNRPPSTVGDVNVVIDEETTHVYVLFNDK